MTRAFIISACLVVVFAGIKASASLVVPFLLAMFLAILLAPPYIMMKNRGVPAVIAFCVMILGLGLIGTFAVTILRSSLDEFSQNLPSYETSLRHQLELIIAWLEAQGLEASSDVLLKNLDPRVGLNYAGNLARALSGMLGQAVLIFIIVAFVLVEASGLRAKLHSIPSISSEALESLERNLQGVRRYVSMKSIMSLLTGVAVALWLQFMDVDNALFMGLLAFFLNFVPTIGSIIASVPGILLAFILQGPMMAMVVAIGYVVINVGISNVLEPRVLGQGLGISPLIIILSLIFWGWLLGPVGMLLSVPLTMAVKIAMESSPSTKSIAIFLGPPPKDSL